MPPARAGYVAPWWVSWLHRLPHRGLRLQSVPAAFRPRDADYQQSLLFLGLVSAVCLGLNLLFLTVYLICLCCCKRDQDPETKRPHSCCVTWMAVTAGLICCAAVGIGFYGNSETNDGVYQLLYALDHANHTLTGIDSLVADTTLQMQVGLEQHLQRLNELLAARGDYLQTLKFLQQLSGSIVLQLAGLPVWRGTSTDLTVLAGHVAYIEYYRWLAYLLFFMLVLTVCLLACLGLAKRSRCLLTTMLCCGLLTLILSWASVALDTAAAVGTSDFCVAPDKFIMNQTESDISAEVVHYYLYCDQGLSNPFQQALTVFQRSLTTMQIQIQGLIQFALPVFPTAEKDLLGVQQLLNSSETSLHQLTAMLDCRGLHKDYLDALIGICYDGVEGLLYLVLFSLLVAASFSTIICATPRAWKLFTGRDRDYDDMDDEDPFNPQARRIASHNPARGHLRSFCSYSSSLGSQSSLHPPAQTISNAPVSEYMNQAVLFGGNPRYENVPLIGRGSPPPTIPASCGESTPRACEPHTCQSPMSTSGPTAPRSRPKAGPTRLPAGGDGATSVPVMGNQRDPGQMWWEARQWLEDDPRQWGSPRAPFTLLFPLGSSFSISSLPLLWLTVTGAEHWEDWRCFTPHLGSSGPSPLGDVLCHGTEPSPAPWSTQPGTMGGSFPPVAMQHQPLVIPAPAPHGWSRLPVSPLLLPWVQGL